MKTTRPFAIRLLIALFNVIFALVRWPFMLVALFLLAAALITIPRGLLDGLAVGSWQREVVEVLVRVVIAVPLAGVAVLLLHPIRGPLMVVAFPWRAVARLIRRMRGKPALAARAATPPAAIALDSSPTPEPSATAALPEPALAAGAPPAAARPARLLYRPLSRRRFMIEGAAVTALMADMLLLEPHWVEITHTDIPVRNLPERFHGFSIAQISDIHLNEFTTAADLARVIPDINGLNADIILVTGDFVDFDKKYAPAAVEVLRELKAREGLYTILGNHDYYSDPPDAYAVASELKRYDLGFLRNSNTVIRRGADKIYLLGTDDPSHSMRPGFYSRADLPKTLQGTKSDAPRIMTLHNPILAPAVDETGVDVAIAGHTHGGQFRVPYITSTIVKNIEYIDQGLYQFKPGGTQFYVNRGFGTVGPPLRFRARPEISLLRLVPA